MDALSTFYGVWGRFPTNQLEFDGWQTHREHPSAEQLNLALIRLHCFGTSSPVAVITGTETKKDEVVSRHWRWVLISVAPQSSRPPEFLFVNSRGQISSAASVDEGREIVRRFGP
jgi:hypothetical protein